MPCPIARSDAPDSPSLFFALSRFEELRRNEFPSLFFALSRFEELRRNGFGPPLEKGFRLHAPDDR
jgi:hypothetical protein